MKWWNKWTRKVDGWVERRRQFEKTFADAGLENADRDGLSADTVPDAPKTRARGYRGVK